LHIYDAYRADLQTQQEFTLEVKRWKARWELYPTDQVRPSHLCETLELVNKKMYPHLYCILKIYLTMPPSTATTEISFSVLKRVKTRHGVTGKTIGLCIATYSQRHAVVDKFNNTRHAFGLIVCKHPLH